MATTTDRTRSSVLTATAWVGRWLLVLAAIPVGALAAVAALLGTAAATGNRAAAAVAGVLALLLCTGGLCWLAMRGDSVPARLHQWTTGAVSVVTLTAITAAGAILVYAPGPSFTPATAGSDTRYWDLPTGSHIAYTYTPARGPRQPTPVILVHGGPGAPYGPQESLTSRLTQAGFDVYDYRQIGAGLSGRLPDPVDYTVARHVADLDAIRAVIGADRVDLVGVSWGGQLIANYLAAHPARVARAVVTSPGPIWSPAFPNGTQLTPGGNRDQRQALARYPRFLVAHALLESVGPHTTHTLLPDRQVDDVYQRFAGDLDMWAGCQDGHPPARHRTGNGSPAFGFWVNAMTTDNAQQIPDPRPALRHVSTPVLVLRAQCDYLAWPVTREYRDVLPNAVLLAVPHAGHELPSDQPEFYATAVGNFLLNTPLPQSPYTSAAPPW
jgi:proline iminopeptidase